MSACRAWRRAFSPPFPSAKALALEDRDAVERITRRFPPYSDFNFLNLYSWDAGERVRLSSLNGNLVIRFADYLTDEPFYMFLGPHRPDETAATLLAQAAAEGIEPRLRLIPEAVAKELDPARFEVRNSSDQDDYIVCLASIAACEGRAWHRQRTAIRHFEAAHGSARFEALDLGDDAVRADLLALCARWCDRRRHARDEAADYDRDALGRCLASFSRHLSAFGLYVGDELAAFSLTEDLGDGYAIHHFEKAAHWSYAGIVPFFDRGVARLLLARGFRYLNLEEDLGLLGLRQAKRARRPVSYLRKFEVVRARGPGTPPLA